MTYEETMAVGAARYTAELDVLGRIGLAQFTQTGGMCAALEVTLDGGAYLLVTDAEDSLAWDPADGHGWGVGLYRNDESDAVAFEDSPNRTTEELVRLCNFVVRQAAEIASARYA